MARHFWIIMGIMCAGIGVTLLIFRQHIILAVMLVIWSVVVPVLLGEEV